MSQLLIYKSNLLEPLVQHDLKECRFITNVFNSFSKFSIRRLRINISFSDLYFVNQLKLQKKINSEQDFVLLHDMIFRKL